VTAPARYLFDRPSLDEKDNVQTTTYRAKRGTNESSLYLAFLIGRTKSTLNYAISRFSAHKQILSLCTDAGRVRPSTRTLFAFSRRGPCVPSRSARGRRMLFIRFVNRAVQAVWRSHNDGRKQTRVADIPCCADPARGRSPRADLDIGSFSADGKQHRQSIIRHWRNRSLRRFRLSLCVTLAPKPTLKSLPSIHMRCRMPASLRATATIAHNMLDRLEIRRPTPAMPIISLPAAADLQPLRTTPLGHRRRLAC
jgi:hypothetical protein